nr:MAG TPA: hypothetical protein [Caudoviricetes sp.]
MSFKVCPCKASEKRCSCRKWSSSRRISQCGYFKAHLKYRDTMASETVANDR